MRNLCSSMMVALGFTMVALPGITLGDFVHNFDMDGDYSQYLYSTTNAQVLHEIGGQGWPQGWNVAYWCPIQNGVWAEIIYKYDLSFTITSASLHGNVYLAPSGFGDLNGKGYIDVSPDGTQWTTIATGQHAYDPTIFTIDLSQILSGSSTAYIRARLYTENSPSSNKYRCSQFLRTVMDLSDLRTPNLYEFRSVPEPTVIGLLTIGILISRWRR